MIKKIFKDVIILISFFCASAGIYYVNAKFHVPWHGSNDFEQYYKMTLTPLDNDAPSPFGYRLFTPTVASYVLKSGLYYNSKINPYKEHYLNHNDVTYDPTVLGALIFTNYIFFSFAAFFIYKIFSIILEKKIPINQIVSLGAPFLLFLSFSTVAHGYTGLTEGGTLFFIAMLCYFYLSKQFILFLIAAFCSILQRELIPFILLIYIISDEPQKNIKFIMASFFAFLMYFVFRSQVVLEGNENQTQLLSMLDHITNFKIDKEFLMQAVLANNLILYVTLLCFVLPFRNLKYFIPFLTVSLSLFLLGIATGIGNNVGRILNMATPILLIGIAKLINQTEKMGDQGIYDFHRPQK
ncbi:MAG: hypothetical protein RJB34_1372 [Pseudomonadota bacterium]|jgi:hypothetical protein